LSSKVYTLAAAAMFVGVGANRIKRAVDEGELQRVDVVGASRLRGRLLIEERELTKFRARVTGAIDAAQRKRDAGERPLAAGARS